MNEKHVTALVVVLGILALAGAAKLGASSELMAAGATALLVLAGSLKSMLGGKSPDEEKKP
jgi:hypothetical protein